MAEPEENNNDNNDGWREDYKYLIEHCNELNFNFVSEYGVLSLLEYTLYDIDNDSVPELIFIAFDDSYKSTVCKIYHYDGVYTKGISELQTYQATVGTLENGQFVLTSVSSSSFDSPPIIGFYSYNISNDKGQYELIGTDSDDKTKSYSQLPMTELFRTPDKNEDNIKNAVSVIDGKSNWLGHVAAANL